MSANGETDIMISLLSLSNLKSKGFVTTLFVVIALFGGGCLNQAASNKGFATAFLKINDAYLIDTQTVTPYLKEDVSQDYWTVMAPLETLASFSESALSYSQDCREVTLTKTTQYGVVQLELTAESNIYLETNFPLRTEKGSQLVSNSYEEVVAFAPQVVGKGEQCDLAVEVGLLDFTYTFLGGDEQTRSIYIKSNIREVFKSPPANNLDRLHKYLEEPMPEIVLTELEWLDKDNVRFIVVNTDNPNMPAKDLLFTYGGRCIWEQSGSFSVDKETGQRWDNEQVQCQNKDVGIECTIDLSTLDTRSELWLQFNKMIME
jgi:hypothetical protein